MSEPLSPERPVDQATLDTWIWTDSVADWWWEFRHGLHHRFPFGPWKRCACRDGIQVSVEDVERALVALREAGDGVLRLVLEPRVDADSPDDEPPWVEDSIRGRDARIEALEADRERLRAALLQLLDAHDDTCGICDDAHRALRDTEPGATPTMPGEASLRGSGATQTPGVVE